MTFILSDFSFSLIRSFHLFTFFLSESQRRISENLKIQEAKPVAGFLYMRVSKKPLHGLPVKTKVDVFGQL